KPLGKDAVALACTTNYSVLGGNIWSFRLDPAAKRGLWADRERELKNLSVSEQLIEGRVRRIKANADDYFGFQFNRLTGGFEIAYYTPNQCTGKEKSCDPSVFVARERSYGTCQVVQPKF